MHNRNRMIGLLIAVLLLLAARPVMAAKDVFYFENRELALFEGETAAPTLVREEDAAEEGKLTFSSGNAHVASVASDGTISGLKKGATTITALLKIGRKSWKATVKVTVLRAVTDVTLETERLEVYRPDDPRIADLLPKREAAQETALPEENGQEGLQPDETVPEENGLSETASNTPAPDEVLPEETPTAEPLPEEIPVEETYPVLLLSAGKDVTLRTVCTPSSASNTKVIYTSSDEGVLQVRNAVVRGMQAGVCVLTVASEQNPEVSESFRVLVVQPMTSIQIRAGQRRVFVGETLQLTADCLPATATMPEVRWSTRSASVASVDANGLVTGHKRGTAVIVAEAADGSGVTASVSLSVEQRPTQVTLRERELNLIAGQSGTLHATVLPSDAGDRSVLWESSDPSVATVSGSGRVTAVGRGTCVITASSAADPSLTAEATVNVVQRVTGITFTEGSVSLPVRTTHQLSWRVEPSDATNQTLTFTSSNRRVASVDANGLITGIAKGSADIYAAATDGSNRRAKVRVQVTQPVEGVSIQYRTYHIQLEKYLNVKALISPSNANNTLVHWSVDDESVATVKGNGRNVGSVYGQRTGTTTITAVTDDGGYSASAEIRVADFNRAVVVDDLYLDGNDVRMTFRNRSDYTMARVHFMVECFDVDQNPLVCNKDGESTFFTGYYPLELAPGESTRHFEFYFRDFMRPSDEIAIVKVTITGWEDVEGYSRAIPDEERPTQSFWRYLFGDEMIPTDEMEPVKEN